MRIARVFPTKTSMTPKDENAFYGLPNLWTEKYDEIHISVTFSWDIGRANFLAKNWRRFGKVRIGGIAIEGESKLPMKAGMYLKKGVTITSRGCPNNCSFCLVKNDLIELQDFPEGNIVQDNNFIACSKKHRQQVYKMLSKQKQIELKGGIDKYFLTKEIADELRSLRIKTLWLACDQPNALKSLAKAVEILKRAGFKKSHLYCYVLVGKNMEEEEKRLREVYKIGCMPFAQLYKNKDNSIEYSRDYKQFARQWSRPAIIRTRMKTEATNEKD